MTLRKIGNCHQSTRHNVTEVSSIRIIRYSVRLQKFWLYILGQTRYSRRRKTSSS